MSGASHTVVEFEFDGMIPSSFASSLSDPVAHPIDVQVVSSEGDVGNLSFTLFEISPHLTATLAAHRNRVNSVAFSPDGTILASGSRGGEIRLWDVNARQSFATLRGHVDAVSSVSFSFPDGTTLASGSRDGTIKLWDGTSGGLIATLEGDSGVSAVSFFERDRLASGAGDGTVKLWDLRTREVARTLAAHSGEVTSVAFSHDGSLLASAGWGDLTVKLWDVASGALGGTLEGHTSVVTTVAFSPDGATVSSGSWDRTVRVWDIETREQIAAYRHADGVTSVSYSTPDGSILASASRDHTVVLWDLLRLEEIAAFGHTDQVHSVSLSPGGLTLAAGGHEGKILLWDVSGWTGPRPVALEIISGDGQQEPAGAVTEPFVILLLDQFGDPLAGAAVTFAVTAGGGTLSATTATTDANGRAATTLTLGRQLGTNTVMAIVAGLEPATFTATGVAIPQTLDKLSGDGQEGAAGAALTEPLVVEVRDQNGNSLPGAAVTFAVTAGGGTLSAATATTDADGRTSTTLTLGSNPGMNTVRATVAGLEPATFTATAKATPDFDGDGVTGFSGFFLFAEAFGSADPRFDLDSSGVVDFADFFLLAESFGQPAKAKLVAMAKELIGLPDGPQLQQNAPNPFNSATVISWLQLQPGSARLEVFALTGQRVAVLHEGTKRAGPHRLRWDGRDEQGRPLASGVYVYRLVTAEAAPTRRLTLLR